MESHPRCGLRRRRRTAVAGARVIRAGVPGICTALLRWTAPAKPLEVTYDSLNPGSCAHGRGSLARDRSGTLALGPINGYPTVMAETRDGRLTVLATAVGVIASIVAILTGVATLRKEWAEAPTQSEVTQSASVLPVPKPATPAATIPTSIPAPPPTITAPPPTLNPAASVALPGSAPAPESAVGPASANTRGTGSNPARVSLSAARISGSRADLAGCLTVVATDLADRWDASAVDVGAVPECARADAPVFTAVRITMETQAKSDAILGAFEECRVTFNAVGEATPEVPARSVACGGRFAQGHDRASRCRSALADLLKSCTL